MLVCVRLIFLCAASLLLLAPAEGDVQTLQAFDRFGLWGKFSANCAEPVSNTYPEMMFAKHSDSSGNLRGILVGIATEKRTFNNLSGRIQGAKTSPDTKSFTYMLTTAEGEQFQYSWIRVGEKQFRLLTLEERTRQIKYITNGIITATGIATPVYERCYGR